MVLDPGNLARLIRHVPRGEIPQSEDLLSATMLAERLAVEGDGPFDLLVGGDVMLGGRTEPILSQNGATYPFGAIDPLLRHSEVVLANLEGPLARRAERADTARNFSYRVQPATAKTLAQVGIDVVTLANNHLVDCGREGVVETLRALEEAQIASVGAGTDIRGAHRPVIRKTRGGRLGILGYYWNRRCAATECHAGSAMDDPAALAADIVALRNQVELLLVTFHWGIPYERVPAQADREKARLAVDLGADIVVSHHPHVIQPFEIYRGCPIFYSVGNLTFGSGNSRAEGMLVGARFDDNHLEVDVFPLYVKNRDPRVAYQPKVLTGRAGARVLRNLAAMSGDYGGLLQVKPWCGRLRLPRRGRE